MWYLLLSVLCSTLIFIVFKYFSKFEVTNIYAIVTNYFVATTLGLSLSPSLLAPSEIIEASWFIPAFLLGFLFIVLFQIMAVTAQQLGVAKVSVPVKMSVVLPVIAGVWLYNESLSLWAILGVVLAIVAVYLGTLKNEKRTQKASKLYFVLPVILFLGSGTIDIVMKYAQHYWLEPGSMAIFSGVLFSFAFFWGLIFSGRHFMIEKKRPQFKDFLGGIALGVPNYGSIYFLLKALDESGMPSASIYPINNVAIVGLSAIMGLLLFKEHLSNLNILGLICGVLSILLIAYA